jgi:hypothetical protein
MRPRDSTQHDLENRSRLPTSLAALEFSRPPLIQFGRFRSAPSCRRLRLVVACRIVVAGCLSRLQGAALAPASQCPRRPTQPTCPWPFAGGAGHHTGCASKLSNTLGSPLSSTGRQRRERPSPPWRQRLPYTPRLRSSATACGSAGRSAVFHLSSC